MPGVDLGSAYGRIELNTDGVEQGVGRATQALGGFSDKMAKLGQKMAGLGARLSVGLTAPLAAIGGLSARAAIQFESAFAGVRKTVDASEPEFELLRDGIMGMATSMDNATSALPDAHEQLAGIMELAGQLGVSGSSNLQNFTDTIAKLTMATNLTAEAAATELARFANITQMSMEDIDELGSVVVALGNSMATTESEIVSMAQRLAAAGSQAGMSEADIMAVSAAMSSVGIAAEAGGTAMSRVFFELDQAARSHGQSVIDNTGRITTAQEDLVLLQDKLARAQSRLARATTEAERIKAQRVVDSTQAQIDAIGQQIGWMEQSDGKLADLSNKQLQRIAEISDMSAAAFADLWQEDSAQALQAFVEGLGRIKEEGGDLAAVLEDLGMGDIRVRDALMRMAGAGDLLAEALGISREAWEENVALQEEAEKRMETTEAQINLLRNVLDNLAIVLGDVLLPILNDALAAAIPFIKQIAGGIKAFAKANPQVAKFAAIVGAVAAALGPVLVVLGKVVSLVATINPVIGAAVAAVGALAFAFQTNFLGIRDAIEPLGEALGALGQIIEGVFTGDLEGTLSIQRVLGDLFNLEGEELVAARKELEAFVENAHAMLLNIRDTFEGAIADLGSGVPLGQVLRERFAIDVTPLETVWAALQNLWGQTVQPVIDAIRNAIGGFVSDLLAGVPLGQAIEDNFGIDTSALEAAWAVVSAVWNDHIKPFVEEVAGRVGSFITALAGGATLKEALKAFGIDTSGLEAAWATVYSIWQNHIRPFVEEVAGRIGQFVSVLLGGGSLKEALKAFNIDTSGLEAAWAKAMQVWDNHIKPFFDGIGENLEPFIATLQQMDASQLIQVGAGLAALFGGLALVTNAGAIAAALPGIGLGIAAIGGAIALIGGAAAAFSDITLFLEDLGGIAEDAVSGDWEGAFWKVGDAVQHLWDAIQNFLVGGAQSLADILGLDIDVEESLARWNDVFAGIAALLRNFAAEIGREFSRIFDSIVLGILVGIRDVVAKLPGMDETVAQLDAKIAAMTMQTGAGYQAGRSMANNILAGMNFDPAAMGENMGLLFDGLSAAFSAHGPEAALAFYDAVAGTQPGENVMANMKGALIQILGEGGGLRQVIDEQGVEAGQAFLQALADQGLSLDVIEALIGDAGAEGEVEVPAPPITMSEEDIRAKVRAAAGKVPRAILEEIAAAEGNPEQEQQAMQKLFDAILAQEPDLEAIKAQAESMGQDGRQAIVDGLIQGMQDAGSFKGEDVGGINWEGWVIDQESDLMAALEAQSPSQRFARVGETIPQGITQGIVAFAPMATLAVTTLVTLMHAAAAVMAPLFTAAGTRMGTGMAAGVTACTGAATGAVVGTVGAMHAAAVGQVAQFVAVGHGIIDGIVEGLKSKEMQLTQEMQGIAERVEQTVKTVLQIRSPSRVFEGIGAATMQGLAEGIKGASPVVQAAIAGAGAGMVEGAVEYIAAPGEGARQVTQTTNQTFNFNPQYADRPDSGQLVRDLNFARMAMRST